MIMSIIAVPCTTLTTLFAVSVTYMLFRNKQ